MKKGIIILMVLMVIGVVACSSTPKTEPPAKPIPVAPQLNATLVWSTTNLQPRPGWTVSEPDKKDGNLFFVGLSGKFAMERDARDDAYRNAISNVVRYIGTYAKDKFERISTTYGLSSGIVDPTKASRDFEEQLSSAFASRVKAKEVYSEQWQDPKMNESYFLSFVLSVVPESVIEKSYEEALNGQIEDLKKKRDAANEEKAKAQFENAMKAFEDAKKQGFELDKK